MEKNLVNISLLIIQILIIDIVCGIPVKKWYDLKNVGNIFIENDQKFNWFQAWNECVSQNMVLITVDTWEKNEDLTQLLRENSLKSNLWIGGHDWGDKGRFVWSSTGKRFTFTNWSKGNPDNVRDVGSCVHYWKSADYEWNDAQFNNTFGFICEENYRLVTARKDLEMKKEFMNRLFEL
uniref:C-type lectin domain-containing protein n=1 Tax=Stomoxys calcitrans TaxID=35570 RepID=A0A1I8QD53_STOCA